MPAALEIEKNFIDAGKTLTASITSQQVGPFDNDELTRPRVEVDFLVESQADDPGRTIQNSNATWYQADYAGTWEFTVATAHTDANHSTYLGSLRQIMISQHATIQAQTNTYYEVQSVTETTQDRTRDDDEDELRTTLRYSVRFSVKPW